MGEVGPGVRTGRPAGCWPVHASLLRTTRPGGGFVCEQRLSLRRSTGPGARSCALRRVGPGMRGLPASCHTAVGKRGTRDLTPEELTANTKAESARNVSRPGYLTTLCVRDTLGGIYVSGARMAGAGSESEPFPTPRSGVPRGSPESGTAGAFPPRQPAVATDRAFAPEGWLLSTDQRSTANRTRDTPAARAGGELCLWGDGGLGSWGSVLNGRSDPVALG